jgi:hypothetical protein
MGHEFGRPKYGDGAEMKRRQRFLEGIVRKTGEASSSISASGSLQLRPDALEGTVFNL